MTNETALPLGDAYVPTVLERADALMKNEHVSWIGTATRLYDLIREQTYDRTPVDALLSDLAVDSMLDALEPDHVLDRIKQFGIEVGTLDAEGKPVNG